MNKRTRTTVRKKPSASVRKQPILITGNEAMAEAALRAGCRFYAGYPITPQNELIAYMAAHMTETGGIFIQAESEVAAINMVFGAAATGARSMTTSSSPGISLKQEGISYIAGAQLPCVIVNVMRGGPGLGNIACSQADYFQATRGGGHGDYRLIVYSPASVQEAIELVRKAFDVADRYRNPAMILADAIIGQMMEPAVFPEALDVRKLPKKDWVLDGARNRPARTVKSFFLREGGLERHNEMLAKKYDTITKKEQRSDSYKTRDAHYLIVSYGSQARISKEAVDMLRQAGSKAGLFRPVSLWPFPEKQLRKEAAKVKQVLVVEQSLGQMVEDVRLALPDKQVDFLGKGGGGAVHSPVIVAAVEKAYNKIYKGKSKKSTRSKKGTQRR